MGNERLASARERESIKGQQERVLQIVVDAMSERGLHWVRDWKCFLEPPRNPYTGTVYQGGNALNLALIAMANGWEDSRWITLGQLRREAAKARERGEEWDWRGQQASLVVKYKEVVRYERDEDGRAVLDEDGNKVVAYRGLEPCRPAYVLNMAQVKGAPAEERRPRAAVAFDPAAADRLAASCVCPVDEGDYPGACYVPACDCIRIPSRDFFSSAEGFASTLAHEYVHATGAPQRLNREQGGGFGSMAYAYEELVAELGSVLVCSHLGFAYEGVSDVENHAAYLAGWLRAFREEDGARRLQTAFSKAQAACAFIVERLDAVQGAGRGLSAAA